MKEYKIVLHNLEEAVNLIDYLERHELFGTIVYHKRTSYARSLMGILSNDLLERKVQLILKNVENEHDLTRSVLWDKIGVGQEN